MRLRIEGKEFDIINSPKDILTFNAKQFESVNSWRTGQDVMVEVLATGEARKLFGNAENPHRENDFNTQYHKAELLVDGVKFLEGEATIAGFERKGERVVYRIRLRSAGEAWAHNAAHTRLRNSNIEGSVVMNISEIEATWSGDRAVRMLPLRRDSYPKAEDTGLYIAQHHLLPHDYHPFLTVGDIVRSIASEAGYTLHSNFLDSSLAKQLVMSGAYRSTDISALHKSMGFKALRTTSTTASAGWDGRVYAWEPQFASNIGAIVDTVNPNTLDESSVPMHEAFSYGGCFTFANDRPTFTPKHEVSAAFDLHLHYSSEYRIASSRHLAGFTTIHIANGCDVEVALHNPYTDKRNEIVGGNSYKLFIFDYDDTATYTLDGIGQVSGKVSEVLFGSSFSGSTILRIKRATESEYTAYDGDWALYSGYVEERGWREITIDVRTPFETLTPSAPKLFNDIFFGGAEEGQQMTLHAGCSIVPVFSGAVGYGERMEWSDVANIDISQAELIEAVAHMFNLRVYSHAPSKSLYIEPYDDFFGPTIVDWRERQMGDGEEVVECATESFEHTRIGYQHADGVAARATSGEERELGTWDRYVENYATKRSTKSLLNPLFLPTASTTEAISSAPSAAVLTIGDRDAVSDFDTVEPRIALYHGVQGLPEGEYWPSPNGDKGYPLATFHSPQFSTTLCFDDRDGCSGLHRYYDTMLQEQTQRQWLECDIRLSPAEYVALFDPTSYGATLRSLFRLEMAGQNALFRLERIESYDHTAHKAHCIFQRRLTD